MRFGFLSTFAFVVSGLVAATPLQEESVTTVGVAESISCEGSHFIVSVQRTDDIKEDSGELIAEKVTNIVFDFQIDREAETLLINGYALQIIPQRVRKINLLAAVIPSNHPALPEHAEPGSIKAPEVIDALNKLERTGLVTANVDLFVVYEGDVRHIMIHVQVLEVEGEQVVHKDLLTAHITVPQHHKGEHGKHQQHHGLPHPKGSECSKSDWNCRLKSWYKSLTSSCDGTRRPGKHGGEHHRHRPRRGFMRFIITVVIPVFIGAAAGVGIGILSVFIAEIVGGLIMRIRGRTNAEYMQVDAKDEDDDREELPVYEELEETPVYTEEKM